MISPKQNLPLFILLVLAFLTRFVFLSYPAEVVFDEVHFGKFVSAYFTHQYYFDIHPPLGKLMIAGFTRLNFATANFGGFAKIGETMDPQTLFILRFLPALFSALFVALIYLFVLTLGFSKKAAFLAGFLVLFDNAILAQSKFILLDIFLLFFGFSSLCFFFLAKKVESQSKKQLLCYILSAIFAGLSFSIKWTGLSFLGIILFLVFLDFLTNTKISKFISGTLIFTLVPFLIYILIFAVHFELLKNSGAGDAFMSPSFQKTLSGNNIGENVKPLSFFGKFAELNVAMYKYNATIKATHQDASQWHEWPLMKKPIWYWTRQNLPSQNLGGQAQNKVANIYFLGNPLIWWPASFSVFVSLFFLFFKRFRKEISPFIYLFLLGYFANLLPFIFVSRAAFLYHYLPSLIFAILALAMLFGAFLKPLPQKEEKSYKIKKFLEEQQTKTCFLSFPGKITFVLYFGFLTIVFLVFLFFMPLTYGLPISFEKQQIYNFIIQLLK